MNFKEEEWQPRDIASHIVELFRRLRELEAAGRRVEARLTKLEGKAIGAAKRCPKCGKGFWWDGVRPFGPCPDCIAARPPAPEGYRFTGEWGPPGARRWLTTEGKLADRGTVPWSGRDGGKRWILEKVEPEPKCGFCDAKLEICRSAVFFYTEGGAPSRLICDDCARRLAKKPETCGDKYKRQRDGLYNMFLYTREYAGGHEDGGFGWYISTIDGMVQNPTPVLEEIRLELEIEKPEIHDTRCGDYFHRPNYQVSLPEIHDAHSLPAFGSVKNCPKCGRSVSRREWGQIAAPLEPIRAKAGHSIPAQQTYRKDGDVGPRLHVYCPGCGYFWQERPKDYQET